MKKLKALLIIGLVVFTTGCSNNNANDNETNTTDESESQTLVESETQLETVKTTIQQQLEGLTQDEYNDLEMTAAVLERKAIIGGASFPVSVTIKNNGDKNISYIHGSGSFEIPEALLVNADNLQTIIPKEHLGIATMDMRTEVLAPGGELSFIVQVRAIEPNENFDTYTYELYNADQTYIAEVEWGDLQEKHTDLVAAATGSYDIQVYFLYTLIDEAGGTNALLGPTGYAKSELTISVTD